jgi:putative transposase
MAEQLRYSGKVISAMIFRRADRWFISIEVEIPDPVPPSRKDDENQVVGVDVGVRTFATLSTGEKVDGPKALKSKLNRLRRAHKKMARRKQGSGRWKRAKQKVARVHYRIVCQRNDFLHKLTTRLVKQYGTVVVEKLCVRGMVRNRSLARVVSDQGFYTFRRYLEYKAGIYGSKVILADLFFPSSKLCSACGYKLETLDLKVREWTCPSCGVLHDRDVNAAVNLRNLAGSSPVTARGAEVRPASTGASAVKRELISEPT